MDLNVNCAQASSLVEFEDTGGWNMGWQADVTSRVSLRPGTNRIVLSTNGGSGPNFDSVLVSPPLCAVAATQAATCEAEAALLLGTTGSASMGSGWSGIGFADMYGGEGAINWVLDVAEPGAYTLTFFYTQDDDRDMTLTLNDVVEVESLGFYDTDNWSIDWIGDVSVEVELVAGKNSVRLATNGNSGPNFDKLVVSAGHGTGG